MLKHSTLKIWSQTPLEIENKQDFEVLTVQYENVLVEH